MTLSIPRSVRRKGRATDERELNPEDASLQPQPARRLSITTPAQVAKVEQAAEIPASRIGPVASRAATDPPLPVRKMTAALMEAERRFNAQVCMLLDALVNLDGHDLQVEEIFEICGKLSTAMMPLLGGDSVNDRLTLFTRHLKRNMSHLNNTQIIALRIGLKFVDTPQTQIECPYLTAIQGAAAKRVRTTAPANRRVATTKRDTIRALPLAMIVSAAGKSVVPR